MAYQTGFANDYLDLLDIFRKFALGYGTNDDPTFSGTGNGTLTVDSTHPATVTETITAVCSATAVDGGTFDVSGSVSGSLGQATVGTPFTSSVIDFTITDGTTDFALNDTFTINTYQNGLSADNQVWQELRWDGNELWLKGTGLAGTDNIYIGFQGQFDATGDWYNWFCNGATAFDALSTFEAMPGGMQSNFPELALWNSQLQYWMVGTGRRLIIVVKVSTVYVAGYFGLLSPLTPPSNYAYPLMIGATIRRGDPYHRWSETSNRTSVPFIPTSDGVLPTASRLKKADGIWKSYAMTNSASDTVRDSSADNGGVWPFYYVSLQDIDSCFGGDIPLLEALLFDLDGFQGVFDGVYAAPAQSLGAETVVTVGADQYMAFPNVYRSDLENMYLLKLA